MKIAILNGDPSFAEELHRMIIMGCAKRNWNLECHVFLSLQELLSFDLSKLQAIFLDIDMPEMNGLDVASKIRQNYPDLILIFISEHLQFAPLGYKVNAFRYILKTQYTEEIEPCLEAIHDKLLESKYVVLIELRDSQIIMPLHYILYFEGTPYRHVLLHTIKINNQILECRGKINEYDEKLSNKGFIRLQKSFLVNMYYINKISSYKAKLQNGEILRASEKNYKNIRSKYLIWKGTNL